MSYKKSKPKNRPSLSTPLAASSPSSSLHLTCFHPSRPLYAVATTAIGQNVIRIYDTDSSLQEVRVETRLKRGEEICCLAWTGHDVKKRKRAQFSGAQLICGLKSGKIYVVEQATGEIVRSLDGHTAAVNDWSVDQDRGWSCGGDGKIKCWDPKTGSCLTTVSPEVEGLDFTSLAVFPGIFFLSSSQTLFLLSNPVGTIISQLTAHTTPIHTIQYSPELNIVTTAAVGDRFINVISTEDNKLTRLGSLTCTHDVRAFRLQNETLLAITVIETLEVFHSYNTNFKPGEKGGMTKAANAEIHLTTSNARKIKVQDAVSRGKETMISWVEGIKTGFEVIDIHSMSGKVDVNIESRREPSQQQTSKPYDESNAVVLTGADPPTSQVNGVKPQSTEVSFEDRLSQLHPQPTSKPVTTTAIIPNASSLSTVLTQALNSSDEKLLQSCFQQSHTYDTIHNTLIRLSPALVPSLLSYFNSILSRKQKQVPGIFQWIREVVVIHGGYLVSQGEEVKQVLVRLKGTLDRRGQSWERLVRLKGRLELLRAVKGQEGRVMGREPEVRWVEEDDEEAEIEDVQYLTGDVDDGMEDVEMVNGLEEDEEEEVEDEGEDDEESADEQVAPAKKANGIPHFSDSEDSAVDLNDLIDDEASEASDNESDEDEEDDEEEEEEEEKEEEEEEEEDIRPPKKSKSRQ